MTHPTDETLLKYTLELLEGEEYHETREHLASCESCRAVLRRIVGEQRIFTDFSPVLSEAQYPLPKTERVREFWWLKAAAILMVGFLAGFAACSYSQPDCVNVVPFTARIQRPVVQTGAVSCESEALQVVLR